MGHSEVPRVLKVARQWMGLGAVAIAALAGCGAPPDAPLKPDPTPVPVATPDAREATARDVLAVVQQAVDHTQTWTGSARTDNIAPDGDRDYNVVTLCYKRPGICAATVTASRDSRKVGTRMVYDGNRTVAIKTYLFGFFPVRATLDVQDDRLLDGYKRSLRDTSTEQLLGVLLDPQAQCVDRGIYQVAGENVELLDLRSSHSWKEVSHEVIGISHRTRLPILRDVYDQRDKVVFHMEITGMKTNVSFPPREFTNE
jgi:hypothetical protein